MAADTTVAIGPGGEEDYRKLVVDSQGRLISASSIQGLFVSGKVTIVSLNASEWKELPSAPMATRNSLVIQNQSDNGNSVLINYDESAPAEGIRVEDGEVRSMTIGGAIKVYARMQSGVGAVAVEELA